MSADETKIRYALKPEVAVLLISFSLKLIHGLQLCDD